MASTAAGLTVGGQRACGADLDAVAGELGEESGGYLGTAGVVDTDEQDRGFGGVRHGRSLLGRRPVWLRGRGAGEVAAGGECHVHEADEHGDLDERADDSGQGLAAGRAEGGDGDRDGELEVVARGRERRRRGLSGSVIRATSSGWEVMASLRRADSGHRSHSGLVPGVEVAAERRRSPRMSCHTVARSQVLAEGSCEPRGSEGGSGRSPSVSPVSRVGP